MNWHLIFKSYFYYVFQIKKELFLPNNRGSKMRQESIFLKWFKVLSIRKKKSNRIENVVSDLDSSLTLFYLICNTTQSVFRSMKQDLFLFRIRNLNLFIISLLLKRIILISTLIHFKLNDLVSLSNKRIWTFFLNWKFTLILNS